MDEASGGFMGKGWEVESFMDGAPGGTVELQNIWL